MINEFFEAPPVAALVDDLIGLHEKRLNLARIRCLFTTFEKKQDGEYLIVWTKKLDPVAQYLAGTRRTDLKAITAVDGADFVLIVYEPRWRTLEEENRTRIVHHELMRMRGTPGKWRLIDGDFEGFVDELVKYGPWRFELRRITEALNQQELPLEAAR